MKVALGVTGCIAAYKAIEVLRGLQKAGVSVQVVLTRAARKFVTPLTFESLSGNEVITDMFRRRGNLAIRHIALAQEARLLAVVPATADILGKFAAGIADDFLSTLYLSAPTPVLLAPAMNVEMWNHPAVRDNIEVLRSRGHRFVDPEAGELACGMKGEGRLAEVDKIVAAILDILDEGRSLAGLKILVTAGPTVEDIDPVRFLSNRSSGKMGYAVAGAAIRRGAEVTLISGPCSIRPPAGAAFLAVRSAAEMKAATLECFPSSDIVIMAAAVADYRPAEVSASKIKKDGKELSLPLVPTDDILSDLGRRKSRQMLIGFAAETHNLLSNAREKMARKNLDMIVANDAASGVFGADSATVHILRPGADTEQVANASKDIIAGRILDLALDLRASHRSSDPGTGGGGE